MLCTRPVRRPTSKHQGWVSKTSHNRKYLNSDALFLISRAILFDNIARHLAGGVDSMILRKEGGQS